MTESIRLQAEQFMEQNIERLNSFFRDIRSNTIDTPPSSTVRIKKRTFLGEFKLEDYIDKQFKSYLQSERL